MKTLIVAENATFRQSLKGMLGARFPFMVAEEAVDEKEALQKMGAFRPELVFVDMKFPAKEGLLLTKKIKPDYPETIIVLFISYDLPEYRQAADQWGVDYVLSKDSSTLRETLELVESILAHRGFNSSVPKKGEPS